MADKTIYFQQEELQPLSQQDGLQFKPGEYLARDQLKKKRIQPKDSQMQQFKLRSWNKDGALLSMASGEQFNEDINNLLTKLGVLKNNAIYLEQVIKFIEYDKNEQEGTFNEIDQPDSIYYLQLGYDTQIKESQIIFVEKKFGGSYIHTIQNKSYFEEFRQFIKKEDKYNIRLNQSVQINMSVKINHQIKQNFKSDHLSQVNREWLKKIFLFALSFRRHFIFVIEVKGIQIQGKQRAWLKQFWESKKIKGGFGEIVSQAEFKSNKNQYDMSNTNLTDKVQVVKNQVPIQFDIIDCSNLPPKDQDSMSDPCQKIRIGKQMMLR